MTRVYRSYIWYDNAHVTTITMIKRRSDLHSRKTSHTSPLRASYGVSFVSYTKKNDHDISRAHFIEMYTPWCQHHLEELYLTILRKQMCNHASSCNKIGIRMIQKYFDRTDISRQQFHSIFAYLHVHFCNEQHVTCLENKALKRHQQQSN